MKCLIRYTLPQTKDNGLLGYYKDFLYEDAITWTTDGANAGTVNYRAGKFYCTNVCGVLLSNEVKASKMIAEALNNVAKSYVSYVGNPKLMNNVMADIEIMIPVSPLEQEKISKLFAVLDNLITLHQREYFYQFKLDNDRITNPHLCFRVPELYVDMFFALLSCWSVLISVQHWLSTLPAKRRSEAWVCLNPCMDITGTCALLQ